MSTVERYNKFTENMKKIDSIVNQFNKVFGASLVIRADSFSNNTSAGDHYEGYAFDINGLHPELFKFYVYVKTLFDAGIIKDITRFYISVHNYHVHVSFNPTRAVLFGKETFKGGDVRAASSYGVETFDINSDTLVRNYYGIDKDFSIADYVRDIVGASSLSVNRDSGCLFTIIGIFLFVAPYLGYLMWRIFI